MTAVQAVVNVEVGLDTGRTRDFQTPLYLEVSTRLRSLSAFRYFHCTHMSHSFCLPKCSCIINPTRSLDIPQCLGSCFSQIRRSAKIRSFNMINKFLKLTLKLLKTFQMLLLHLRFRNLHTDIQGVASSQMSMMDTRHSSVGNKLSWVSFEVFFCRSGDFMTAWSSRFENSTAFAGMSLVTDLKQREKKVVLGSYKLTLYIINLPGSYQLTHYTIN